ncbi:MAG: glycosyltransferase family 4 protein [Hyphomicrobiales bacterium]
MSHTFIQREVAALRAKGEKILTCTVRRSPAKEIMGPGQAAENTNTFCIQEAGRNPLRLISTHIRLFSLSPKRWFSTLKLAMGTSSQGPKAFLYQLFYFAEAGVLAEYLIRNNVRHLHNHFGSSSCSVAMLTSALSGVPYSFTMHGPNLFFEVARWRIDEKIARAQFVSCISYFCRSQAMLFSDQKHWPKLRIIHCGVVIGDYGRSDDQDYGKNILFIGRLSAVKGAQLLLEAFASLLPKHPMARLTIVGDGEDRPNLEGQAQTLGLQEVVRFVGYRDQREVASLLKQSDMLVLPSFAEGVPVVLMEAMASCLPVIASQVAGVSELVEDNINGFVVPPGDLATLTSRLNDLLSDPEKCRQMGSKGRAKVEAEFNIEREAERLLYLFDQDRTQDFTILNARDVQGANLPE